MNLTSWKRILPGLLLLLGLCVACSTSKPAVTPSPSRTWLEEEVTISYGVEKLYGVLTLPPDEGPHPAIILISGSVDSSTGLRDGASGNNHILHAHRMVVKGFAVLRYDPPGVGRSTGEAGFEPLEARVEEAMAALRLLQSRADIRKDQIGMWGISQGSWVISMAVANFPGEVAFIISVSGSGVSVVDQQIYSIEAQSKAAGRSEDEIRKAVLIGRLLMDWQLPQPRYQQLNMEDSQALGEGPWTEMMTLVYEPGELPPQDALLQVVEILKSIQDETWAAPLFLKEVYLPQLESIRPEQLEVLKAMAGSNLLEDPKAYLTRVRCPVLAFFGEADVLQPSATSIDLFDQYLRQAGNNDVQLVLIPGVGHEISLLNTTYSETMFAWLEDLYSDP
jgi:pimeloyl-ACP methyl ester carboxylesterase